MSDHQVRLASQCVENSSELYRNVASSNHNNTFRLVFEVEESVRVDTVTSTRNFLVRRDSWSSTDGNVKDLGLDFVRFSIGRGDLDGVGIEELGKAFVVVYMVVPEILLAD